MKNFYVLFLVLFCSLPLFSQEITNISSEKNVIKVNTLSAFVGTGSIFYERRLNEMNSLQMGVAYLRFDFDGTIFSGLVLTPEYRFYPKANAIDGIYVAPYLRFQQFEIKNGGDSGKYSSFGGGALFGKQWILNSGFTMDLFFGATYSAGELSAESNQEEFETEQFEGFKPRIGFAIGIAF